MMNMKCLMLPLDSSNKWYFTGKPCKNGHIAPRLKSNRSCRDCSYAKREKYEKSEAYTQWKLLNKQKVCADWQKANKGSVNATTRKYQAAKLNRTPVWTTEKDVEYMRCLYQLAEMRSKYSDQKWHVDHIIPLQGKTVSGFHTPSNLQVIPAIDNLRKNNLYGE